ncbi:MAG: hypothetical protein OEZ06_11195 [Myxococcales bacterium]|nr:hypothetical protein [Myxococcales bacterium]
MKSKRGLRWALCLALTAGASACQPADDSGLGGSSGECGALEACGGELSGSWDVRAVCFTNPEEIFPDAAGHPECADLLQRIDTQAFGSYVFDEDGSGSRDITLEADMSTVWSRDCIRAFKGDPEFPINSMTCSSLERSFNSGENTSATCKLGFDLCDCVVAFSGEAGGAFAALDANHCREGDTLKLEITEMELQGTISLRAR